MRGRGGLGSEEGEVVTAWRVARRMWLTEWRYGYRSARREWPVGYALRFWLRNLVKAVRDYPAAVREMRR